MDDAWEAGRSIEWSAFFRHQVGRFERDMPIRIKLAPDDPLFGGPFKNHAVGVESRKAGCFVELAGCQEGLKQRSRCENPPLIPAYFNAELDGPTLCVPGGIIGKSKKNH